MTAGIQALVICLYARDEGDQLKFSRYLHFQGEVQQKHQFLQGKGFCSIQFHDQIYVGHLDLVMIRRLALKV